MRKIFFAILFVFGVLSSLKAQYDGQFSNYWAAMSYYNPAVSGQTSNMEMTALYRLQNMGIPGSPRSFLLSGDRPIDFFGRTHGAGIVVFNESIGLFKRNIMSGQYSYKKKIREGTLSAGLQVGMISETFDGSNAYIPESDYHQQTDDGILMSEGSGTAFDFAAGVYYSHKNWYAGLSVAHILEPEIELSESAYIYPVRSYYLTGGYNIELNNPFLVLQPSVMVKSTIQMNTVDVNMRLCYNKILWAGLGWRYGDAVMITLGAKFGKIQAGYAYDVPISFMRAGTSGSHELFLKYTMQLTPGKGNKNKYKSVRIL